MNRFQTALVLVASIVMLEGAGCRNTAEGIKADTRRAVDKIDQKLDKDRDHGPSDQRTKKGDP